MSFDLTAAEKAYLRELKMNGTWGSIMHKLASFHRKTPRYRPGQGDSKEQELDWIYWSGVDQGTENLLKLLGNE